MEKSPSVLIIYTGGTIGMVEDPVNGTLKPFDFDHILKQVPELKSFGYHLETLTFNPIVDSSNIDPDVWIRLAGILQDRYEDFDGFVILHGTDTMAYTASALSFMLENQYKPVILTGSQLPIGKIRTDGKENLITAIEIAAKQQNGMALVPEVCIYFEYKLFRGNRTSKYSAEHFNAFHSPNYSTLAEAGIEIKFNYQSIHYPSQIKPLIIHTQLDNKVGILKIFPGMSEEYAACILLNPAIKALVLETYGSGNASTAKWFTDLIVKSIEMGKIILNVSQCNAGSVIMGKYDTSVALMEAGVQSGHDITTEAAISKLMFVLGNFSNREDQIKVLNQSISGEITCRITS